MSDLLNYSKSSTIEEMYESYPELMDAIRTLVYEYNEDWDRLVYELGLLITGTCGECHVNTKPCHCSNDE